MTSWTFRRRIRRRFIPDLLARFAIWVNPPSPLLFPMVRKGVKEVRGGDKENLRTSPRWHFPPSLCVRSLLRTLQIREVPLSGGRKLVGGECDKSYTLQVKRWRYHNPVLPPSSSSFYEGSLHACVRVCTYKFCRNHRISSQLFPSPSSHRFPLSRKTKCGRFF